MPIITNIITGITTSSKMLIPIKKIAIIKKTTTKKVTKPLNTEILLRLNC